MRHDEEVHESRDRRELVVRVRVERQHPRQREQWMQRRVDVTMRAQNEVVDGRIHETQQRKQQKQHRLYLAEVFSARVAYVEQTQPFEHKVRLALVVQYKQQDRRNVVHALICACKCVLLYK